jgi:hypothetical protein
VYKSIRIAALLLAAPLFPLNAAYADADGCELQPAVAFPFFEPDVSGRGKLCLLPGGLLGQLSLRNLIPGNAYTVWWTYQDDPTLCTGDATGTGGTSVTGGVSGCEFADFQGDKPLGIFGRMASGVAPRSGRLNLRGELGGMQPSNGSEVWFWVFTHGAANLSDGTALARQLLTPEDPGAGAPHLGNTVDGPRGAPAATVVFTVD